MCHAYLGIFNGQLFCRISTVAQLTHGRLHLGSKLGAKGGEGCAFFALQVLANKERLGAEPLDGLGKRFVGQINIFLKAR